MKLVYTHANRLLVSNAYNILEEEGLEVVFRNEFIGGAAGDLSPFDTWLEVWVKEDVQQRHAQSILEQRFKNGESADWNCHQCGEINGASFEICWNCQHIRPIEKD